MRSKILYVPEGIVLNLSEPSFGHPDGLEIIERHYHPDRRRVPEYGRSNPAFVCMVHLGDTNPGLFLKKIDGDWWAAHYEAGPCPSHRIPAPMSDEHKRQAEYWARAAENAGWYVEAEKSLHTGTRPDVLIYGPVSTGVEVQRSPMTAAGAVTRTRKAAAAGVSDVWFTANPKPPKWAWRVPTVLNREFGIPGEGQAWDSLPARRTVTAAGLRTIHAVRCIPANFSRCPYGQRHCEKFHPQAQVWRGLTVDDIAAKYPAGEIVAIRFWGIRELGSRRRDAMLLVSSADRERYTELTGQSGMPLTLGSTNSDDEPPRQANGAVECRNTQTGHSADGDVDPYRLGAWHECAGCQRRYRPVHPSERCYDCRSEGKLSGTVDLTGL